MKKDLKKIVVTTMLASTLATTIAPFYSSMAAQGPSKYANGVFTGEGYGFYRKEEGRNPIRVDVEFNNDKIVNIKLHDDKDNYKFPDDKVFGNGAYARVGKFLLDKLKNSNDYESTLEKIETDLDSIFNKNGSNVAAKRKEYGTVTGATRTSSGITRATEDAVLQAKNSLNAKAMIKKIAIVDKSSKKTKMYVGDYIDLSNLEANVTYSKGNTEKVKFNDFKVKGLEVRVELDDNKIEVKNNRVKIEKLYKRYKVIVSDKKSKFTNDYYTILSSRKILEKNDLYYRIGDEKEFKKAEKDGNTISYTVEISSSNFGDPIEFMSKSFTYDNAKEAIKDEYYYKTSIIPIQENNILIDNRGAASPEDDYLISPSIYEDGQFRVNFKVNDRQEESVKDRLDKLIEANKDTKNEKIKEVIGKFNKGNKSEDIESKKKDIQEKIKEKEAEYDKYTQEFSEISKKFSEENKEEAQKLALENINKRKAIFKEKENLYKEINDIKENTFTDSQLLSFIKDIEAQMKNDKNNQGVDQASELKNKLETKKKEIKEKSENINQNKDAAKRLKHVIEEKIKKADKLLSNKADSANIIDMKHMISELDLLESKILNINDTTDNKTEENNNEEKDTNKKEDENKDTSNEDKKDSEVGMSRIAGKDRYETSVEISKNTYNESNTAILVNGKRSSDALTAGPLAKAYNAPVLFINESKVNDVVKAELKRLKVKDVILVGGQNSISEEVKNDELSDYNVSRIAGKDRYETSYLVAQKAIEKDDEFVNIVVVNGENSVDALSAANLNESKYGPILLTKNHALNDYIKKFIRNTDIKKATILGGETMISDYIEDELEDLDVNYERIAGRNRYETSALIAKTNLKKNELVVASGSSYEDALSVSPYVISKDANVLLVNDNEGLDGIKKHINNIKPKKVTVIGGYNSVSNNVKKTIKKAILKIK